MNKKGKIGMNPKSLISGLLFMVILFAIVGIAVPVLNASLNNLSTDAAGAPFISLFASNGFVILALMAAVIMGVVAFIGLGGKG